MSGNINEERQGQRFFLIKLGRVNKAAASWSISACTLPAPAPALQLLLWSLNSQVAGKRDGGPGPRRLRGCFRSIPKALPQNRSCTTKRRRKLKNLTFQSIGKEKEKSFVTPTTRGHVLNWQQAETGCICSILQRMCQKLSSHPWLVCLQDCNKPHSKLSCKISIGFTVQISLSDNGVS